MVFRIKQKNIIYLILPWMVTKGLIALTPQIDCDQTAIGLPPVTSAVFQIAIIFTVSHFNSYLFNTPPLISF
jgi:ABC-type iron transport system FetAB permease component